MAQLATRNKIFSDLDLDFDIHPNTKKLNVVSGPAAVARSLRHLIMTSHYERKFHPEIGCTIRNSLFDLILDSTAFTIRNSIVQVVENFEPRVQLDGVQVIADPGSNRYEVIVRYFIINEPTARTLTTFLERIR